MRRVRGARPALARAQLQRRYVEPAPFGPRLESKLGELNTLRALEEIVWNRLVRDHVPQEHLPLHLERVVELAVRHACPLLIEVERVRRVRIPYRARRSVARLDLAAAKAGNRAAMCPVD